eukprot:m.204470 g.204470  ORF g.204470 m.204470 type:complete len:215 (-) comp32888_c5_seq1:111-755(-)
MDDEEIQELFVMSRARRTVMQMCRDRGFDVAATDYDMDEDSFIERFGSTPSQGKPKRADLDVVLKHKEDENRKIGIFFPDATKIGISEVRIILTEMEDGDLKEAIIITKGAMTPSAKKGIESSPKESRHTVQCFQQSELIVNITEHEMVPKHELLSSNDKKALLLRYKLTESQLPRIKVSDPVAKYYGLVRGQVVKITRHSPTAGRYVTYRLVH